VRITADGKLVVFHDATLQRMCGRPNRVDALPFSQVRRARLPDGSVIPTLNEALEAMAGQPVLVEVKIDTLPDGQSHDRRAAKATAETLRYSNALAAMMSFDVSSVQAMAADAVGRPVGVLLEPDNLTAAVMKALPLVRRSPTTPRPCCTFLAPHVSVLDEIAEQFPEAPCVTWTVRTGDQLAVARAVGAASIFEGCDAEQAKAR
jgi:glycerophosphoryl diester phosphodiesterase